MQTQKRSRIRPDHNQKECSNHAYLFFLRNSRSHKTRPIVSTFKRGDSSKNFRKSFQIFFYLLAERLAESTATAPRLLATAARTLAGGRSSRGWGSRSRLGGLLSGVVIGRSLLNRGAAGLGNRDTGGLLNRGSGLRRLGVGGGSRGRRRRRGSGGLSRRLSTAAVLAGPDSLRGEGEVLVSAPDAEVPGGISLLVATGEFDHGAWDAGAVAGDLDLGAAVVELSLAVVGTVDTDVLGTDEVFTRWGIEGDLEFNVVLVPGAPGVLLDISLGAETDLLDQEPVTITLVLLDGAGSQRHVNMAWAWVLHGGADTELHGQLGSRRDLSDAGAAGRGESTLVAAEVGVIGGDVVERVLPLGRVVLDSTSVLTNELVRLSLLAIDDKTLKEVMGGGDLRNGSSGEE